MVKDTGTVVETKHELLYTYDVTDKHYCINERGNPLSEIIKEIHTLLKKDYPGLLEQGDYFGVSAATELKGSTLWPMEYHWVCVHYVRGGSEGFYIHVATVDTENKYRIIFLGKTLLEGYEVISWAEKMVAALSRILSV